MKSTSIIDCILLKHYKISYCQVFKFDTSTKQYEEKLQMWLDMKCDQFQWRWFASHYCNLSVAIHETVLKIYPWFIVVIYNTQKKYIKIKKCHTSCEVRLCLWWTLLTDKGSVGMAAANLAYQCVELWPLPGRGHTFHFSSSSLRVKQANKRPKRDIKEEIK